MEAEKFIPDLRTHIKIKVVLTPDDFKSRINVVRHSFGGLAPIIGQIGPSHQTPINNLWYIGAYSESGGGIMGVIDGTRSAIKNLLEETKE